MEQSQASGQKENRLDGVHCSIMGHMAQRDRGDVFYSELRQQWCMLFPGADSSVIRRSQRYLYENQDERPVQFGAYVTVSSLFSLCKLIFLGFIFSTLTKFSYGRTLLEKQLNDTEQTEDIILFLCPTMTFPRLFSCGYFSHEGPTPNQIENSSFSWTFYSEGFSKENTDQKKTDLRMTTQVSGPEPGYVATPIALIQAALVILNEKEQLPPGGGVFTPGAAFNKTSLVDRLDKHGLKFTVVSAAEPITA